MSFVVFSTYIYIINSDNNVVNISLLSFMGLSDNQGSHPNSKRARLQWVSDCLAIPIHLPSGSGTEGLLSLGAVTFVVRQALG